MHCKLGPFKIFEAIIRCSLSEDKYLAKTDSVINVSGSRRSKAFLPIHLPVPLSSALSKIKSNI